MYRQQCQSKPIIQHNIILILISPLICLQGPLPHSARVISPGSASVGRGQGAGGEDHGGDMPALPHAAGGDRASHGHAV